MTVSSSFPLPPQAYHCCLEGLESTHGSADHVRFLQSVTGGGPLLCTVVQQAERRVVRLSDPRRRPPLDINAAVRETVAAAGPEPAQGQLIRAPPTPTVAKPPVSTARLQAVLIDVSHSTELTAGRCVQWLSYFINNSAAAAYKINYLRLR